MSSSWLPAVRAAALALVAGALELLLAAAGLLDHALLLGAALLDHTTLLLLLLLLHVLLDYGVLVVHVQHEEERQFYALERLWRDCPVLELPADVTVSSASDGV